MAYHLRLDAGLDDVQTAARRAFFLAHLEADGGEYLAVEEVKASGQVHWQALLYTCKHPKQYRNSARAMGCKKNEYECNKAPKPDGFIRYLCKGRDKEAGGGVDVIGSRGAKYTPGFVAETNSSWHEKGDALRAQETKDKGFAETMYNELVALQQSGTVINYKVIRGHLHRATQASFKVYMPAMFVRQVVLLNARFDSEADQILQDKYDVMIEQELSKPNVGEFRPPPIGYADTVQKESQECPCPTCTQVSSNDPLEYGTQITCSPEENEDEVNPQEWRDLRSKLLYQKECKSRQTPPEDPQGSLEASGPEQEQCNPWMAELYSIRGAEREQLPYQQQGCWSQLCSSSSIVRSDIDHQQSEYDYH